MPFSAPTGFMAPPLPGVFVAVSCNGTLEQGLPFRVRAHSNYFVVVAFWIFVACTIYTCPVIGVRCCKAWAIHPVFENMFFRFRYSFCHTSYVYPLPFSATAQIITSHTRYTHSYLMKQLYFVCNQCWTYSRHVNTLHELCWGCHILESTGWEFWTPGRGGLHGGATLLDVHFLISFIRFPLDPARCHDFSKLAHPSQTLYCQSSRMVQLTSFVQTQTLIFFH